MVILGKEEIREINVDAVALRVFLKALELIGGPQKVIEYRNLTWIPSLLQASYAVVLSKELLKTSDEIAETLGLTRQTVQNMLRADPQLVKEKLSDELKMKEIKVHTAGGLAQWAYEEIKAGNDSISFLESVFEQVSDFFDINWPVEVLKRVRGRKFPLSKDEILGLLGNMKIEGKPIEELRERLPNTVKNPSELLHILKEALKG